MTSNPISLVGLHRHFGGGVEWLDRPGASDVAPSGTAEHHLQQQLKPTSEYRDLAMFNRAINVELRRHRPRCREDQVIAA